VASGSAHADATITVGTGGCTLPSAITAAETGTASGGCPAGDTSGLSTIVLPAGVYANHGLVIASGQIAIVGDTAADTIIDAGSLGRGFQIDAPATVTLQNITIENGLTAPGGNGAAAPGIGGGGGPGGDGGAVINAGHLTIANSTLTGNRTGEGGTGGDGTGTNAIGGDGGSGGSGGAVSNSGTLTISDSTLSSNVTGNGNTGGNAPGSNGIGGIGGSGGSGGAVSNSGTLTIANSTLTGNVTGIGGAGGSGGAIAGIGGGGGSGGGAIVNSGTATITATAISGNVTGHGGTGTSIGGNGGDGGGVEADGGTVTIATSSINGNLTGNGGPGGAIGGTGGAAGGIENFTTLTLSDSTIASNNTGTGGGGGDAGGLLSDAPATSPVTVSDSTVAANTSQSGNGDAIELIDSKLNLVASTVASNEQTGMPAAGSGIDVLSGNTPSTHSTLTEHDTLVATNGSANCALDSHSTLASLGHNLSFPDSSCAHEVSGDPKLGPLQSNGGPTETMALGAGSAAIDQVPAGDSACASTSDQRGVTRPVGAGCDLGAFEVTPTFEGTPSVTASATAATIALPVSVGTPTTVRLLYGAAPAALSHRAATQTVTAGKHPAFSLAGLSPLTTYYYEVQATSPFGSLISAIFSFKTLASNAFRVLGVKVNARNRLVLTLSVTDAGRFSASSTYKVTMTTRHNGHVKRASRTITFGRGSASTRRAGKLTLTITPTGTALSTLRASRTLRVSIRVTFTPTGGRPATRTKTLSVHYR
jgi:hypothetical protein